MGKRNDVEIHSRNKGSGRSTTFEALAKLEGESSWQFVAGKKNILQVVWKQKWKELNPLLVLHCMVVFVF